MRDKTKESGNESGASSDADTDGGIVGGCEGTFTLVDEAALRVTVAHVVGSGGGTSRSITVSRWVLSHGSVIRNGGRLIDVMPVPDTNDKRGCYGIFRFGDGTVLRMDVAGAQSFANGTDPTITGSHWYLSREGVIIRKGPLVSIMRVLPRE